jgi:dienelactone hydrolase
VPAVILLHGCSGITGGQTGWVSELGRMKLATFLVDSFDGRNIRELCTARQRLNTLSLVADAYRALDLVATHPQIDPARIALMGFSMGGRTALWASYATTGYHPQAYEKAIAEMKVFLSEIFGPTAK